MSFSLILVTLVFLVVAAFLARRPFGLETPAKILIGVGVFGALLMIFGVEVQTDLNAARADTHWLALLGTLLSFIALIGLLSLVLIWAIRRWGIKHDDNPEQF